VVCACLAGCRWAINTVVFNDSVGGNLQYAVSTLPRWKAAAVKHHGCMEWLASKRDLERKVMLTCVRVQAWMYRNDVASNRSSFSVMNVDTKFALQQVRSYQIRLVR
jgi:hypothetical protein